MVHTTVVGIRGRCLRIGVLGTVYFNIWEMNKFSNKKFKSEYTTTRLRVESKKRRNFKSYIKLSLIVRMF